jgi:hypothetical protein
MHSWRRRNISRKTIYLLINHVWKLHELFDTIVSDRESQFISLIWKALCEALKINIKLSTAFHSKTDEQSEIANQKMKRYLRNYCNYQQNDWINWLSIIELAFNVCESSFIELSSFMTNYDHELRMSFDFISVESIAKKRILTKKACDIFDKMKEIWNFIKKKLVTAQKSQKRQTNKTRKNSSDYKVENLVWLSIKNIKTSKSFKKLNHKMIDFYKITRILKNACELNLFSSVKNSQYFSHFVASISINKLANKSNSIVIILDHCKRRRRIWDEQYSEQSLSLQ